MDFEAYQAKLIDTIVKHGQVIQGVGGTPTDPSFAYTIGLSADDLPEIITFSLPMGTAQRILNDLCDRARKEPLTVGYYDGVVSGLKVALIDVTPGEADEYVVQAQNLFGTDIPVMQMVWPDTAGLFPWQDGYSINPSAQPVLGTPPPLEEQPHD